LRAVEGVVGIIDVVCLVAMYAVASYAPDHIASIESLMLTPASAHAVAA
jgi:hypothetical protein